jgi:transposase
VFWPTGETAPTWKRERISTSSVERFPASLPSAWSIPKPILRGGLRITRLRGNQCEVGEPVGIIGQQEWMMTRFAAVDVASRSGLLVLRDQGRTTGKEKIAQTAEGHAAAIKKLRAFKPQCVVLEATGIYYLDLAVALKKAGLPVAVINPKSYHHFAKLKLVSSKSDGIDGELLAEYAERMSPPLWQMPDPTCLAVRDFGRQINRLTATRTQAKNRLHALRSKRDTHPMLIDDEIEGIADLDRRIARLQKAALQVLKQRPELAAQVRQLDAAKGIAIASALALVGELCVLPQNLRSAQISRHAGLDVRLHQSGTSVSKAPRLSKTGNAYLRAALYMPALSAVRYDRYAKAFYEALLRRGKKKLQALCAVMRKMLTGCWACIKTGTAFDSSKLYSEVHLQKA